MTPLTTYFYPRPPRGGRRQHIERCSGVGQFLSTPSARRATAAVFLLLRYYVYFYPRPPRGGRRAENTDTGCILSISIHALREEGDVCQHRSPLRLHISIHALREEGDYDQRTYQTPLHYFYPRPPRGGRPVVFLHSVFKVRFLSTPSARRATFSASARKRHLVNFYPRPPRGGRRAGAALH